MRPYAKLLACASMLLVASGSFGGSASGQFTVKVALASADGTSCTSSVQANTSVSVVCQSDVFVRITPVTPVAQVAPPVSPRAIGRFMPGFQPGRDTLLPDFCRGEISRADQAASMSCRLDDSRGLRASREAGEGWEVEQQLYAVNTGDETGPTQARQHRQDERGILTALRITSVNGRSAPAEMLVSF
jgi:hypothetical protein